MSTPKRTARTEAIALLKNTGMDTGECIEFVDAMVDATLDVMAARARAQDRRPIESTARMGATE